MPRIKMETEQEWITRANTITNNNNNNNNNNSNNDNDNGNDNDNDNDNDNKWEMKANMQPWTAAFYWLDLWCCTKRE